MLLLNLADIIVGLKFQRWTLISWQGLFRCRQCRASKLLLVDKIGGAQ